RKSVGFGSSNVELGTQMGIDRHGSARSRNPVSGPAVTPAKFPATVGDHFYGAHTLPQAGDSRRVAGHPPVYRTLHRFGSASILASAVCGHLYVGRYACCWRAGGTNS